MDTTVIAMRLQKLDDYLRSLRQMQDVTFDQFSQEIVARFLPAEPLMK